MMVQLLLSFLLPWLIGLSLVILCFRESFLEHFILKVFLGLGLGVGITSSLYFFFSLVFDPSRSSYFLVEGLVLVSILILTICDQSTRKHSKIFPARLSTQQIILMVFMAVCFIISLWTAADVFSKYTIIEPHGRYDAWAIWNYRARFIYRGGVHWLDAISPLQFHPDYPLLTPLSISRAWLFMNDEVQKAVILLAGLFTFGSIGLISAAIGKIKSLSHGMLAGLLLAGTGMYIYNGAILFADVPQSFFVLSAVVMAYIAITESTGKPGLAILAGLSAGYAGWVKNEGLMFFAVAAVVTLAVYLISIKNKNKPFVWNYLAGMALPLLTVLYFKAILSPQNDLINPGNLSTIFEKIIESQRYEVLAREGLSYLLAFGGWSAPVIIILVVFAVIAYSSPLPQKKVGVRAVILMVLFQAAGYIIIYLITPFDLTLHIRQSILRLIIHIYPAFLFVLFLLMKTPEQILSPLFPALFLEKEESG